ncbi:MAG: ribosome maturation factor RimP [Thiothrix sp.]|nr:MAG: ribosome maturation factor RimP [Thiothrix sp.]
MNDSEDLEQIIEPIVKGFGCELWGYDYRAFNNSALLRVYIDKENGVTLDDCASVNHQLSGVLDVEDPIKVAYTLEVSSPGIERPLLKLEHYQMFVGERIKLRLKWPVEEQRNYVGILRSTDESRIELMLGDREVQVPVEAISRGRLLTDIDLNRKGAKR